MIKEIDESENMAKMELDNYPWQTRPGMEVRKAQAIKDLDRLKFEYKKEFLNHVAKVFVSGDKNRDFFVNLFKGEGAFVESADRLYREISAYIEPQVLPWGSTFNSNAYMRLIDSVVSYARNSGLMQGFPLKEPLNQACNDFNDLVKLVKNTIRNAYGDSLNSAFLTNALGNEALTRKFDKDIAMFVLTDLSPEEKNTMPGLVLANQPSFALDLNDDETPTRAAVLKMQSKINDTFRKMGKVKEGK